jgi:hypothetical protein
MVGQRFLERRDLTPIATLSSWSTGRLAGALRLIFALIGVAKRDELLKD